MNERFTELLPWYVNGTISATDRAWVEGHLSAHPEAAAELRWYRSLRDRIHENAPEVSPEIGMDRALSKIHGDARIRAARAQIAKESKGGGIRGWFASLGLSPALALAVAVIAVQAGFMVKMNRDLDTQYSEIRSLKQPIQTAAIRVTFKPDAREEEMRLAIASVSGVLVAGPGSLGDYYLRPEGALPTAVEKLKATRAVESAVIVDRLPVRD